MPTFNEVNPNFERTVVTNHRFINALWSEGGDALREEVWSKSTEQELAALLAEPRFGFEWFPGGMQFIIVDIEGARSKSLPAEINRGNPWYALVLPPRPTRSQDAKYKEQRLWAEASFHASNDGYGM